MQPQQRRAVFSAALAVGIALLCAASALVADRTGLYCLSTAPSGPPLLADGAVAVGTDASIYTPDAPITITYTNHTGGAIYLFPVMLSRGANCWGIAVERREHGDWQGVTMQRCFNREAAPPLVSGYAERLAPGEASGLLVDHTALQRDGVPDALTVPGTYRVIMHYVSEAAVPSRAQSKARLVSDSQLYPLVVYLGQQPTS